MAERATAQQSVSDLRLPRSSTRDAFLSAIKAAPDDDFPRLVYADYLDEIGESERARFIRVQIALATRAPNDPSRPDLLAEERSLFLAHRDQWCPSLPKGMQGELIFRRGILETLHITKFDIDRGGYALLERVSNERYWPEISEISLARERNSREVSKYLEPRPGASAGFVGWLLKSPYLRGITSLDLSDSRIDEKAARQIARSEYLRGLTKLNLRGCGITDADVALLAKSDNFGDLSSLNLSGNELSDTGVKIIAELPSLQKLKTLDLSSCQIGDAAANAIAQSDALRALTSLNLSRNWITAPRNFITAKGAQALASSNNAQTLTSLNLGGHKLGREGASAIARSGNLRGLTSLDLSGTKIGPQGMLELATHGPSGLKSLNLAENLFYNGYGRGFDCRSFEAFAESCNFPALTSLNLADCHLQPGALRAIARSSNFTALTSLSLAGNYFNHFDADELATSKVLQSLTSLDLSHNEIGWAGAAAIGRSDNLRSLAELDLSGNDVDGYNEIRAVLENLPALNSLRLCSHNNPRMADAIPESKNLPALTHLDLSLCKLGSEHARCLLESENLPALKVLDLRLNHISLEKLPKLVVADARSRGTKVLLERQWGYAEGCRPY